MDIEQKHLAMLAEARRLGRVDPSELTLCFELLSLAAAIDRDCAARLSPYQLSEGKFVLLFLLRGEPRGYSPHELSARAGVTRATITGLLDGLERDGFLARHHATDDRRKITVQLTGKGEEIADALFTEHAEWIKFLFYGLSKGERDVLSRLLDRIWQRTTASAQARTGTRKNSQA